MGRIYTHEGASLRTPHAPSSPFARKVWFRELPESVFGADRETGIVAPIVDGQ